MRPAGSCPYGARLRSWLLIALQKAFLTSFFHKKW